MFNLAFSHHISLRIRGRDRTTGANRPGSVKPDRSVPATFLVADRAFHVAHADPYQSNPNPGDDAHEPSVSP